MEELEKDAPKAKGMVLVPDDEDNEKKIKDPEPPDPLESYDEDAYDYETTRGLPSGWADWMIKNQWAFDESYLAGRYDNAVTITVEYDSVIVYDPPWESEEEHLAALEEFAELAYPNWDFTFCSGCAGDVTVVLGSASSYTSPSTDTIVMRYETIFAHEFAHIYGTRHHYNDTDLSTIGDCYWCPPDEGECIMDRNRSSFGPAERFSFNLADERYDESIDAVVLELLSRYPEDYLEQVMSAGEARYIRAWRESMPDPAIFHAILQKVNRNL
jgi:hypothetical protein